MELHAFVRALDPLGRYRPAPQLSEGEIQVVDDPALDDHYLSEDDPSLEQRKVVRPGARDGDMPFGFVFTAEGDAGLVQQQCLIEDSRPPVIQGERTE